MRRLAAPPPRLVQQSAPTSSPSPVPQVTVNHYHSNSHDKLNIPTIPGFRTSAAFLTSLSANLRIDPDLPSPLLTPSLRSTNPSGFPLPPPSPLSFSSSAPAEDYNTYQPFAAPAASSVPSIMSLQPLSASDASATAPSSKSTSGLPQLSTYTTSSETERVAALKLVADSVAQQRQIAAKSLITHPINLAAYVLVVAIATRYLYTSPDDLLLLCMTLAGITMVALAGVRMAVGGYLSAAEEIDWDWLGEDKMIVVRWGEVVIGALVLGWADNSEGAKKRGTRRRRGKAVVRAWAIRLKYRGKGVGEGLLEEAVKVAGNMGADGIVFDGEHANSKRVLPGVYNGFLNKQEARAEKKLEKVADEKGNFRQRRSSPTWGSR